MGEGHPWHPPACQPLQGAGRDGQPSLPLLDGGSSRVPLHHPDQADAPLVPCADGLQHESARPHPGPSPVHPRLGAAGLEAVPAAGPAAEQEPAQLVAQAPVQDGPD